jgi:hypothetical protein
VLKEIFGASLKVEFVSHGAREQVGVINRTPEVLL